MTDHLVGGDCKSPQMSVASAREMQHGKGGTARVVLETLAGRLSIHGADDMDKQGWAARRGCVVVMVALTIALASCGRNTVPTQQQSAQQYPQRMIALTQLQWRWWQARWIARGRVLADLSPAHRLLLANVIGQLSVAKKPDISGAGDKLDGALTAAEKRSILAENAWLREKTQPLIDAETQQLSLRNPSLVFSRRQPKQVDAGKVLLVLTTNSIALETSLGARGLSTTNPEVQVKWH